MRFFSLFTFATLAFSAVSALPVSKSKCIIHRLHFCAANRVLSTSDIVARDDLFPLSSRESEVLETRGKYYQHGDKGKSYRGKGKGKGQQAPQPPPKITFEKGVSFHSAANHLNRLDLYGGSRKKVEDHHRKDVAAHMATIPGAQQASIKWVSSPSLPSLIFMLTMVRV